MAASSSDFEKFQTAVLSKLEALSNDMKHMSHRMSMLEKSVESMASGAPSQCPSAGPSEVTIQAQTICSLLAFSHSLNMVFYGLGTADSMSLEAGFRKFMVDVLHIEPDRSSTMPFHIVLLPRMSPLDVHQPVCITLRSAKDRDFIKHKCEKYEKNLAKFRIGVKGNLYGEHGTHAWKCNGDCC